MIQGLGFDCGLGLSPVTSPGFRHCQYAVCISSSSTGQASTAAMITVCVCIVVFTAVANLLHLL